MRVAAGDFKVLGRDTVGDGTGLFHVAGQNQRTALCQALGDDGLAGHLGQQTVDLSLHRIDVSRIGAQQDGLGQFIMLGLAEQIHGHPLGRGRAIGQDQNFRRAGNHVYAHHAKHTLLGAGHIGIAGAGDLVHLGHGGRAVGQAATAWAPPMVKARVTPAT